MLEKETPKGNIGGIELVLIIELSGLGKDGEPFLPFFFFFPSSSGASCPGSCRASTLADLQKLIRKKVTLSLTLQGRALL